MGPGPRPVSKEHKESAGAGASGLGGWAPQVICCYGDVPAGAGISEGHNKAGSIRTGEIADWAQPSS